MERVVPPATPSDRGAKVGYNIGGGSLGVIDDAFLLRFPLVKIEEGGYDFYSEQN